jgi:hypothetical protein
VEADNRLFSIGNLSSLYSAVWPECWSTHEVCDKNWIAAVTYLQIIGELLSFFPPSFPSSGIGLMIGIIVGQILVGFEGDWIGRRFGLVQDALIMTSEFALLFAEYR